MKGQDKSRREFIEKSLKFGAGLSVLGWTACSDANDASTPKRADPKNEPWFKISLAQWSLHRMLQSGKLDNLDFAKFTKDEFDIEAIEYVSAFFKKGTQKEYLKELNQRASDNGVKQLLIMVDGEGELGNTDDMARKEAVINHYKWVEAAKTLGCHSIRVNAFGEGSSKDVQSAVISGLGALAQYAMPYGINVIVENHGSYSSDGKWLSEVMRQVNLENCGTLPDFGNFCMERVGGVRWGAPCIKEYNRYLGVAELMPYAKGVSAKSHDFDKSCNETKTNYRKMLQIVKEAKYTGYIGIEYEGDKLSEVEGIRKTIDLLTEYNV